MTEIATIYAVFATGEEAHRIARTVVEESLAACANILGPCQSIYRWQGAIEESAEVPALFKTTAAKAEPLIARIAELHSYDVPAVVMWPMIGAFAPYANWVADT